MFAQIKQRWHKLKKKNLLLFYSPLFIILFLSISVYFFLKFPICFRSLNHFDEMCG